jgi:undecaprenyl-diphosphatase
MSLTNGMGDQNGAMFILRRCQVNFGRAVVILLRRTGVDAAWTWPLSHGLGIAAGAAVFILLAVMFSFDAAAIGMATRLPTWITWSFEHVTGFGLSGWFLWPLGSVFLVLAALPTQHLTRFSRAVLAAIMVRVGFLFLAIAVPGLFATTIKRVIGRARPLVTGDTDPFAFAPFIWRFDYASLPSGHATTVFSALVAFGLLWPRARPALLIYALLISVSRVVVLAHYPSDILAGALVGIIGVLLVRRYFALRRLLFSIGPDGAVHQHPGPSLKRIKAVARELLAP